MRAGIAGLGLIGASVGLGLARAGHEVAGYEPDAARADAARSLGAASSLADGLPALAARSDVLFLCAPPRANRELLRALAASPPPHPILVTDTGSVKAKIAALGEEFFPAGGPVRFVPGHPMAGGESPGPGNARADLFRGATWYLCPAEAEAGAPAALASLIETLGARVQCLAPAEHDHRAAWLSHAPQVLAYVLAAAWRRAGAAPADGGPVARELGRIAASPAPLWAEVAEENHAELGRALRELGAESARLADVFARGDEDEVRRALEDLTR